LKSEFRIENEIESWKTNLKLDFKLEIKTIISGAKYGLLKMVMFNGAWDFLIFRVGGTRDEEAGSG
jgi:hypothetical protein